VPFNDSVDNFIVVKTEEKIIEDFGFSWLNCLGIASDNAGYMTKAIEKLKELHNQRMLHIRCFSHIVNLALGIISENKLFDYFQRIMKMWCKFMKKSKGSQTLYLKFLKDQGFKDKLCPQFVKIRWCSFWETSVYLHEYIVPMKQFLIENEEKYSEGKLYEEIKKLLVDELNNEKLLLLEYLYDNAKDFLDILNLFEGNEPINHLINDKLTVFIVIKYPSITFIFLIFIRGVHYYMRRGLIQ